MHYAAIVDTTERHQFPALLAIVAAPHAQSWLAYFRSQAGHKLSAELITDPLQVDDYLNYGMRQAQWIPPLVEDLRRAGVDARRAAEGMPELKRGPEAWWRSSPDSAGREALWPDYLPWATLPAAR